MLDPLTLDQLRVLVAVADTGSFSAAARALGRVQSAVSQAIQTLEQVLGSPLFDRSGKTPQLTEIGKSVVDHARHLLRGADVLRARAQSMAEDVEPELTLAVDPFFPHSVLKASLKALSEAHPCLPVTLFTEGLGGPEQRLREGSARLAIYSLLSTGAEDLDAEFLLQVPAMPVVAATHPLARIEGPVSRSALEDEVQLVLTDRTVPGGGIRGGGIISQRVWRFADLATRLEFLLDGFGWCNMPVHLVEAHIASGRLKPLKLAERTWLSFPIHVVHERGRSPGQAGRWLIADIRERLAGFSGKGVDASEP